MRALFYLGLLLVVAVSPLARCNASSNCFSYYDKEICAEEVIQSEYQTHLFNPYILHQSNKLPIHIPDLYKDSKICKILSPGNPALDIIEKESKGKYMLPYWNKEAEETRWKTDRNIFSSVSLVEVLVCRKTPYDEKTVAEVMERAMTTAIYYLKDANKIFKLPPVTKEELETLKINVLENTFKKVSYYLPRFKNDYKIDYLENNIYAQYNGAIKLWTHLGFKDQKRFIFSDKVTTMAIEQQVSIILHEVCHATQGAVAKIENELHCDTFTQWVVDHTMASGGLIYTPYLLMHDQAKTCGEVIYYKKNKGFLVSHSALDFDIGQLYRSASWMGGDSNCTKKFKFGGATRDFLQSEYAPQVFDNLVNESIQEF